MQGRRTKRSRSQKIFNIKAGGGAGATGTALNARIIYKNISLFLNQLDKNTLPASGTAGRRCQAPPGRQSYIIYFCKKLQ